jgi:hypothetical protein
MLKVYHSFGLMSPALSLQPFAGTVTLHVRLFPLQWHLTRWPKTEGSDLSLAI